ncbi:PREDICTED: pentatricopeptide repeat-containing protein At5g04780 [Tarenaya hassleriana]|uniref:pentatricopeptide repeat-containing protein At5g04780 n=1 Tax=Tarenaya hassleriana TaxID=28532 RepID=UPI00053C7EA6|nr:PREDICTED: pentatricopeptide repeat-containing protein At5g04780 [Tarenaya hassleriana]
MNILSRCRIIPINHLSSICRNPSTLAISKPDESLSGDKDVWSDRNVAQSFEFRKILQLCARNGASMEARACHGKIIRFGFQGDVMLSNVIINVYSRCGLVGLARQVFDGMPQRSLVSWNTMMALYNRNGEELKALNMFFELRNEGVMFNEFTISSLLCACVAKSDALDCKQLHCLSVKTCLDLNMFVGTALLDLYAKSGLIKDAMQVFESMQERSLVTWSSMVVGYVHNKFYEEALLLFSRAQRMSLEPNQFTISSVICACANLAALIEGTQIHAVTCKTGLCSNVFVASSLVDMYAKCGGIRESYIIFSEVEEKNIVLWNAMISGFAKHARSVEVMILFEKMQQDGIYPNEFTFSSLLSACGHTGLVEKGRRFFQLMKTEYNLSPNVLHYSCMVDIFGRSGHLSEAYELILSMPFDPTASIWGSLLGSCRVYKNIELAEVAAKKLFELEPENAGNHVLLSNIYAANKKWEDIVHSRKLLRDSNVKKVRGKSWIEIKNKVHTFSVVGSHHPRIQEINAELDELLSEMKRYGYEPDTRHELHDVEEGQKEELLRRHSEKLALAFGLMGLPKGSTVRIMKNLRICGDCHEFMKVASMVTRRCIIVRDVNRFHHFSDGHCSCGEFW